MQKILITGGSGLIGKELALRLASKAFDVRILGRLRQTDKNLPYTYYQWNIEEGFIDPEAVQDVDCIVHLAGENISEKRWTKDQKIIIEASRVKSTELLFKTCKENHTWPKTYISASAIGYYGTFTSDSILTEENPVGNDFLAMICAKWEKAANLFANNGVRLVIIRTGVVLSKYGGAYQQISNTVKNGFGSALGTGNQYVPWIHIEDIVNLFLRAIEDEKMDGIFNGVAPQHITNMEFTSEIFKSLNKKMRLPKVPAFVLKTLYGEMADILLKGSRISSDKLKQINFKFEYPEIKQALYNLTNS